MPKLKPHTYRLERNAIAFMKACKARYPTKEFYVSSLDFNAWGVVFVVPNQDRPTHVWMSKLDGFRPYAKGVAK